MSRRSQRNRRTVDYSETAADEQEDTQQPVEEQPQTEKSRGRGRRGRAAPQPSEDSQFLQPATQRGQVQADEQQVAEDEEGSEQHGDAMETQSVHPPAESQQQEEAATASNTQADAVAEKRSVEHALDSQETQSDEMKDDEEQSDSDEEWSEEKPRQSVAEGRSEAIVLSDDEVDNVFALTRPAHAARLRGARKEASSGNMKKPRAAAASKKSSTLLPPASVSSSSKGAPSQRAPVTVSKDDAILLEDSLDGPPARPRTPSAAISSTTTPRPHSTAAPVSTSRKSHKPVNSRLPFKPRFTDGNDGHTPSQAANLASMRAILGPALPDSTLLRFLVSANYNCERAISNILDTPQLINHSRTTVMTDDRNGRSEPAQLTTQQHQQPATSKKRSRESSDVDSEDNDGEDDKRWFDRPTVKQPTAEHEERKENEKEAEEEEQAPVPWDRKLLVVLRVEASCTTEGTRVVSLDESITFRDQSRDTYHQRMLRTQLQQQSQQPRNRKQTKQLRKDLRAERKKEHRILRFVPSAHLNALEIGTLPRAVSDVLVPLFDRRLIDLSAVVTAPCPVKFDLLSTIPLLLSVYAVPALFRLKREVRVETKGFLGKVVSTAADQQLNPVDTFLALLSSFHIEPVSSSIREEGIGQFSTHCSRAFVLWPRSLTSRRCVYVFVTQR